MCATLHYEDWGVSYGSPYLIEEDVEVAEAQLAEPATPFHRDCRTPVLREVAFVDGVRRLEGLLALLDAAGGAARGVVGAHAVGAVICAAGGAPALAHVSVVRMAILGSGRRAQLPAVDGYRWEARSIASADPDAPVADLQGRMREAEARLAERLTQEGWLTILDGPLNHARALDQPIVGYVKTHLRRRLPPELHAQVPGLAVGQRTPLFLARQCYSAYVRVARGAALAPPWSGIVRIEVPESQGLEAAAARADAVAGSLARFAGVAHKDPRAPQNLLPVGALERQLRHRLGPADRAARAVRLAVAKAAGSPLAAEREVSAP
jgi:hypothetical protein